MRRIVSFGTLKGWEITLLFLFIPFITVLARLIDGLFHHSPAAWPILTTLWKDPLHLLLFALFTMIFGPLAEEIGWRGYLLDQWQKRGIYVYGIFIGVIWAVWHLPMFFIRGSYQNGLLQQGFLPVFCFFVSTVALGILIAVFAKKSGAILPAICFHFMINFCGETMPLSITADMINTLLLTVAAGLTLLLYSCKRLSI